MHFLHHSVHIQLKIFFCLLYSFMRICVVNIGSQLCWSSDFLAAWLFLCSIINVFWKIWWWWWWWWWRWWWYRPRYGSLNLCSRIPQILQWILIVLNNIILSWNVNVYFVDHFAAIFENVQRILYFFSEGYKCLWRRFLPVFLMMFLLCAMCITAFPVTVSSSIVMIAIVAAVVDGSWGAWNEWSGCSSSCGGGQRVRRRRCDFPAPSHGGHFCVGSDLQHGACNREHCPGIIPKPSSSLVKSCSLYYVFIYYL